ncbi:MAG: DUF4147 domain-containing protein [Deltaproteobacteria bacterium]
MRPEPALLRVCRDTFAEAVRGFDLAGRVERALRAIPRSSGRTVVVAAGKSAATMVAGLARSSWVTDTVLVARPTRSLAVEPSTLDALAARGCAVREFATGHPLPDESSTRAAEAVRATLATLGAADTVLVLLSGGASAALCLPRGGLSLEDLRLATRTLLAYGAPIDAVNDARGRLDAVKHGGLAVLAGRARVHTLVSADVLGDDEHVLHAVGSAPTLAAPPAVLAPELLAALPPRIAAVAATPRPTALANSTSPQLVARPGDFREACATVLSRAALAVTRLDDAHDDVETVARRYAEFARVLAPGTALVAIGEPTVRLPESPGRGGRSGRLALSLVRALATCPGVVFLAAGSDGVDGESGHAGAVVDDSTLSRALALGLDPGRALDAFDDASFHEALGACIDVPPTGLNLLDVHVLARR